jgi:hypothetical protein
MIPEKLNVGDRGGSILFHKSGVIDAVSRTVRDLLLQSMNLSAREEFAFLESFKIVDNVSQQGDGYLTEILRPCDL